MARFRVLAPLYCEGPACYSLRVCCGAVTLRPGDVVALDPENEHTLRLLADGGLQEV